MTTQKGKIVTWFADRGFGFIQPEGTRERSQQVFMHHSRIKVPATQLREGTIVEFEVTQGPRGPQAQNVRLPGLEQKSPPQGYRFLNPYNFVRYLPYRQITPDDPVDVQLMGHTTPPPHDRWLGLSGRIECRLETITPLFISDSESVQVKKKISDAKKHYSYRFFRINDRKAVPASTLRGTIRSVFEAVTNSAFSNLGGERLSYRLPSGEVQKLVPARVEKEKQNGETHWRLRLLPGTAPFAPEVGQKKGLYAAPARFYKALKPTGRWRRNPPPPIDDVHQWQHGQEYYAVLRKMKFPPSWRIMALFEDRQEADKRQAKLRRESRDEIIVQRGWLCRTNQNSDNKNSERFFFREPGRNDVPETIPLPDKVREKYEALIKDYQTRHEADVKKRRHPDRVENGEIAFSRFILNKREAQLRGGELVYVRLHGSSTDLQVDFIAPVSWPRVAYDHTVAELLPGYLHRNVDLDALDPASRTFGWVHGEGKDRDGAYAGRVHFSHGLMQQGSEPVAETTLAILGSPKPTTTRFYLIDKKAGKPQNGRSDADAGYDGNNQLRGRKFYRHFLPNERHMTREEQSDQNRTIRDAEGKGAIFTFTVEFENLAPVELGALLWSLTLDGKGYHKIGYGKPLGLGSVEISVNNVTLRDPALRYQSLANSGELSLSASDQDQLLARFREAMCRYYVVHKDIRAAAERRGLSGWRIVFEDLPNVKDLLALLDKKPANLPVHYPYSPEPNSQGQFEWFVGNNRLHGPKIELDLAIEDSGLPLIDKKGSIR